MARLSDDAQWIVLMGFIVSFSLFFLAILINQSTIVGQTTAEAVAEFPKNDIRGVRDIIIEWTFLKEADDKSRIQNEIQILSFNRQNSVVSFSSETIGDYSYTYIHYNNGVTGYNETYTYP